LKPVNFRKIMLDRREVLKLSAAAAVTPVLMSTTGTDPAEAKTARPAPQLQPLAALGVRNPLASLHQVDMHITATPRVAVGYWDGMLTYPIFDASGLADDTQAAGAFLTISGGYERDDISPWKGFGAIGLNFDLRPMHDGELSAWHYQSVPVVHVSSVTSFYLPSNDGSLQGFLDFRDATANAAPARVPLRLALRRGYFIVALSPAGTSNQVDWSELELRTTNGGDAIVLRDSNGTLFSQPHVVIEVHPG
jgi:hypothetical protein